MNPAIDNPDAGDDAYLVCRAREGDLHAYEILLARHAPHVYRVALRMIDNPDDAEDVAQEALVAAWQALPRFRAEANFTTWLHRVATTRALNFINRTHRPMPVDTVAELADQIPGPAEQAELAHTSRAVANAIAALSPPQRAALVLHHFERLTYAQIADLTATTVPAVRSHLHRARRTLATRLQDWR